MRLKNSFLKIRVAEGSQRRLLLLLVISADSVSRISKTSAAHSKDHPYVDTVDLKSETCLNCHPTKNHGKFLLTAVGMGGEDCLGTASKDNRTTITLTATGGDLGAMWGEAHKDRGPRNTPVLQAPCAGGQW